MYYHRLIPVEGEAWCYFCLRFKAQRRGYVGEELPPICERCLRDQALRREHDK